MSNNYFSNVNLYQRRAIIRISTTNMHNLAVKRPKSVKICLPILPSAKAKVYPIKVPEEYIRAFCQLFGEQTMAYMLFCEIINILEILASPYINPLGAYGVVYDPSQINSLKI